MGEPRLACRLHGHAFARTLNGTAIAISRAIIAILENHQEVDGSVAIPAPLVPWMGKDRVVPARGPCCRQAWREPDARSRVPSG